VFQLLQVRVQYRIIAGCGNTPYDSKGYYHDWLCGAIAHKFCCNNNKSSSEASIPTCVGDAFGTELTKSYRFGSSGLNLTFEGLLLGVSISILMEGTRSDPASRVVGFITLLLTQRECLSCFAGG
jgi:hypothetical protein